LGRVRRRVQTRPLTHGHTQAEAAAQFPAKTRSGQVTAPPQTATSAWEHGRLAPAQSREEAIAVYMGIDVESLRAMRPRSECAESAIPDRLTMLEAAGLFAVSAGAVSTDQPEDKCNWGQATSAAIADGFEQRDLHTTCVTRS
jgi:hypothetical protein